MSKTPTSKSTGQKTPTSKTPTSKTPPSIVKSSSRNGLLPPMTQIKYSIDIDVIKCPACLEVFKSPRVLSCGHSLCLECLHSNIMVTDSSKTKGFFQCVVCRKSIKPRESSATREKWAAQFPVNAVIVKLLRNATIKNNNDDGGHKAFCEICLMNNTTKPAMSYCNSCLEYHCTVCARQHEKRDENKDHEIIFFGPREPEAIEKKETTKTDWSKKSRQPDDHVERRVKIYDPITKEVRLTPIPPTVVSQTVTASDSMREKHVTKLTAFNGKGKADTDISDFKGATFLTDYRLVLVDGANKKMKVFDVSHKSRVELISDIVLRADPSNACRVDANTVAVLTERAGTYHVRLFTIRDKIYHFVHRIIDGLPLGIGYIQNTVICSFLGDNSLKKYRLSRAQQLSLGTIKEDRTGNDIFHHPGAMCSGKWNDKQVVYVADETEYGVKVIAVDVCGERKASVFFEFPVPKPKSPPKRSNGSGVPKTGRSTRSRVSARKDDASDTTNESEAQSDKTVSKQSTKRQTAEQRKEVRVSGRHTFRRVDEYGASETERNKGREIERPPLTSVTSADLVIDLDKLTRDDDDRPSLDRTLPLKSRREGKAVERTRKKPVGKVAPQLNGGTIPRHQKDELKPTSSALGNGTLNGTLTADMAMTLNNTTIGANSTCSTVTFAVPPKLVYRADSLAVDNNGNIYMCISSMNKVHQMSPDGRVKRELLTEKDGIAAPKMVCFPPSNDMVVVTCKKSNKVHMFKLKEPGKPASGK